MIDHRAGLFVIFLLALASSALGGSASPYFPETGRAALHQRSLDIAGGAVVMVLAMRPGEEDFSLLARARMAEGAQVVTVYVTNGEATPSDASGDSPVRVAAFRHEEAYQAMTLIGGSAHFLNLPDPGVVSEEELHAIWNADSAVTRLALALLSYRPDLVVVERDLLGDSAGVRGERVLIGLLRRAMTLAVKPGSLLPEGATLSRLWKVGRVVVEAAPQVRDGHPRDREIHPLFKRSYPAIGSEAAKRYRTLQYQLKRWLSGSERTYEEILPRKAPLRGDLVKGFPVISHRLAPLWRTVRGAIRSTRSGRPSLLAVASAIDSVDLFLGWRGNELSNPEVRLVSNWKNGLEDLRCTLLNLRVVATPSDSLLTENQVFYLTIDSLHSETRGGKTRILFPMARDHKRWAVNESIQWQFDLKTPEQFSVLSLPPLPYNTPGSLYGIRQSTARVRFSFLIFHADTMRAKNFAYRGEVLLLTGPKRTFELVTPTVRALDGERIVTSMLNISRDGFDGSISLNDSLLSPQTVPAVLTRKDQLLLDTLELQFIRVIPPGTYPLRIDLSGKGGTLIAVARRFDAAIDSTRRVALLSGIEDGPTAKALSRLRVPWRAVSAEMVGSGGLPRDEVLLVDRDALAAFPELDSAGPALRQWVSEGGRLLVLPQFAAEASTALPWGSFVKSAALAPTARLWTKGGSSLLGDRNTLDVTDWENWVVARAWGSIIPHHPGEEIVRDAASGVPLVVRFVEGRGSVVLIALDCISQFQNVHPGAHRFLANLISGN
jgi:hypothetical protein